jgi:hypothetical protein
LTCREAPVNAANFRKQMATMPPIDPRGIDLLLGYYAIEGWLRGYFTGLNIATYSRTGGDITKGTKPRDWMITFSTIANRILGKN